MWVILCLIVLVLFAFIAGSVMGFNNSRCHSPASNKLQGRLRLDDCRDKQCHMYGVCKYGGEK